MMNAIYYPLMPQIMLGEVNALPMVYLNRVPVYYYVFVISALLCLGIIVREALFNIQGKGSFTERLCAHWRWLFFALLAFFLLIDLKVISFQGSRLVYHIRNYGGKSLDQARAIVTGYEIYEFANFCQEKIPLGEPVKLFAPDTQTRYKQLAYYLYPLAVRPPISVEEADYLIFFNAKPEISEEQLLKEFRIQAVRKQGQVILERINKK